MGIIAPMAGPQGTPDPAEHPLVSGMTELNEQSRVKYDKLVSAKSMLDKVQKELGPLAKLGDLVSQEDVVKTAGKLVGHGLGAASVAGLLADMPQDGQALGAWVQEHLQQVTQRQAQLAPVLTQARHTLGVHALQLLAAHHLAGQPQAGGPPPGPDEASASSNPLGAGAPSGGPLAG